MPRSRPSGPPAACLLLLCALLLVSPGAFAATVHRTYEASATQANGAPGQGGGFTGVGACNPDTDSVFDTTACVRVPSGAAGRPFSVTGVDAVFGTSTYFVGGVDLDGDGTVACQGVGAEPCWFGRGGFAGTLPAGSAGHTLRVFPVTVHTTGVPCCPDSFATRGTVSVTFA